MITQQTCEKGAERLEKFEDDLKRIGIMVFENLLAWHFQNSSATAHACDL